MSAHFRGKRLLFINPPVVCASNIQIGWYSYAHPTSLLKLARHQRDLGHHVTLIDCMEYVEKARPRMTFYKKLPLGAAALNLERSAYILGRGFDWLRTQLQTAAEPDEIWVSCHITFNAELAHQAIRLARERFPNAPVVFGGNYPTLFPDDAGRTGATPHVGPVTGAERCYPDYSLFDRRIDYVVFQLALGCMNNCTHCLNPRLPRKVVRLDPGEVAACIARSCSEHGVRTFVNIDPNTAAFGLEAFLEQVVSRELNIDLYFYGGIQPDLVTSSLVRLMQRARVKGFTLPAELGPTANAALNKSYSKSYLGAPQMFEKGTAAIVPVANMLNTFPYKNRVEGQSPDAATLDGARIVESFEERGGGMHNCMTGCIVKCSNIVHDAEGNYKTSALEFETLTLLGANCAVASWEDVADMDRLCDELGLDTIETGAAIGILMDAGQMEWGDAEGMKALLREIPEGGDRGNAIGNGAVATGKFTGHHRVPHARGQAIPAWDPRPLKATGVTYCTSPMGADHTAGLIVNPGLQPDQFAWESQKAQLVNAVCDSSGFCQFLQPSLDNIREFYGALYGQEIGRDEIADQGWQCLVDEWAFNDGAGFTADDDVLADCMAQDAIGGGQVFDVPKDIIQAAKQRMPSQEDLFTVKASG
jgi:hypothetical protein